MSVTITYLSGIKFLKTKNSQSKALNLDVFGPSVPKSRSPGPKAWELPGPGTCVSPRQTMNHPQPQLFPR